MRSMTRTLVYAALEAHTHTQPGLKLLLRPFGFPVPSEGPTRPFVFFLLENILVKWSWNQSGNSSI